MDIKGPFARMAVPSWKWCECSCQHSELVVVLQLCLCDTERELVQSNDQSLVRQKHRPLQLPAKDASSVSSDLTPTVLLTHYQTFVLDALRKKQIHITFFCKEVKVSLSDNVNAS